MPGGHGALPLPSATVQAIQAAGGVGRCSNLSLALNRFVDAWRPGFAGVDDARRRQFLAACIGILQDARVGVLLDQYQARQAALLESYRRDGWQRQIVRGRLTRRLVIGLGIAHPLETNLALHRIGGFPYLPGSTVKGGVRAAAEELDGADSDVVRRAFGPASDEDAHARGVLVFLDAFPEPGFRLAVDVMTPHHRAYYTGSEPPADWQSPNPILFPCVERGSVFRFAVACRDSDTATSGWGQIMDWLNEALRDGLGGKRSAGYGAFEVIG
ncbi:MAG: type III-B CRISPR module RAMP protein Cmr6 [Chloroflexi bacterium]|nr:type III-B CRISPR module RAMP protein Cmr6 [Chloroflexota bacterium]